MAVERIAGGPCGGPFPIYEELADTLATAHRPGLSERDAKVAVPPGVAILPVRRREVTDDGSWTLEQPGSGRAIRSTERPAAAGRCS